MSVSILISKKIYNHAKKIADLEGHSVSKQIEYWAILGKSALDNPDLPIEFINDILTAKDQGQGVAELFKFPST